MDGSFPDELPNALVLNSIPQPGDLHPGLGLGVTEAPEIPAIDGFPGDGGENYRNEEFV